MKSLSIFAASVAGIIGCASMAMLSLGVAAAAPDVVGKQYSDAKSDFSSANLIPHVATVVGDQVPQDRCYVVSTSQPTFLDQNGTSRGDVILVNLNCYPKPATASNPGFSAGDFSPAAKAIRATQDQQAKEWMGTPDGQEWCHEALIENPDWGSIPGC
ncbi:MULTISPECIES: PASTA domain-containing protein [unclassified Mycobacterium]|uniref:PASTA domain-containing protein n=1 Tax=unclassified Mycobacterium TaxID=2642494 RepID=UPI0029C7A1EF|nr:MULTISPECIES: PASTA domain-containing protein [unclassified Mycobacterium]